jgi:hypothetical protein
MRNIFFIYINKSGRNSRKRCGGWELTSYGSSSRFIPSLRHGRENIKRDRVNKVSPKLLRKRIK